MPKLFLFAKTSIPFWICDWGGSCRQMLHCYCYSTFCQVHLLLYSYPASLTSAASIPYAPCPAIHYRSMWGRAGIMLLVDWVGILQSCLSPPGPIYLASDQRLKSPVLSEYLEPCFTMTAPLLHQYYFEETCPTLNSSHQPGDTATPSSCWERLLAVETDQ